MHIMIFMKRIVSSTWLNLFARFIIGGVFIYSGIAKLMDLQSFANAISQYDLLPQSLLAPVAIGLPSLEFLAGVGLIFNIRGSLSAIFTMLLLFVFVLWYGILRDLNIDCGCFSPEEIADHNSLKRAFYRDVVMIGAVLFIYLHRYLRSDHPMSHRSSIINLL